MRWIALFLALGATTAIPFPTATGSPAGARAQSSDGSGGAVDSPSDPQRARTPLSDVPLAALPASAPDAPASSVDDAAWREIDDLLDSGDLDGAQQRSAALAASAARHWRRSYVEARLRLHQGQLAAAQRLAREADALRPAEVRVDFLLSLLLWNSGERPEAVARMARVARTAQRDDPRVSAAWHHLARMLSAEGWWRAAAEAAAQFDRAVWDVYPEHRVAPEVKRVLRDAPWGAWELQIDALRQAGALDELAQAALRGGERFAEDPAAERVILRALLEAGRAPQAWERCANRPRQDGASPDALTLRVALAAGRLDDLTAPLLRDIASDRGATAARLLARQLESCGAVDAGLRVAEALRVAHPADADAAWHVARLAARGGKHELALDALTTLLSADATVERLSQRLMEWRALRLTAPALLDFLAERRRTAAGDSRQLLGLGFLALGAGRWELSAALFRAADSAPCELPARVGAAHAALAEFDWERARQHADAALELDRNAAAALFVRAAALDGLDHVDEAQSLFKRAAKRDPNDPAILVALARSLQRQSEGRVGAQRYYQDALALDPWNAEVLEALVDSYLESRKVDVARARIEKTSLDSLPDDVARRLSTALRFANGPADEFAAELERQLRAAPEDWRSGLKLAAVYLFAERWENADALMERVQAATGVRDEEVLFSAALVKRAVLDFDASVRLLEEIVRRYPNRPYALESLAEAQLVAFRVEEARTTLRRLLALAKTDADRGAVRGRLLQSYVQFGEAGAALDAFADDPALSAPERLALLIEAERFDEALKIATQEFEAPGNPEQKLDRFARLCMLARRPLAAEPALRARLKESPDDALAVELLIRVLDEAGRGGAAPAVAEALVANGSEDALVRRELLAEAQRVAGDTDRALKELNALLAERSVQSNPQRLERTRRAVLTVLIGARRFDDALARIEVWLPADSTGAARPARLRALRGVYQAADRTDDYIRASRELHELTPRDEGVCNDLGYTLADRGEDMKRSTEMIRRAVRVEPLNAAYLDSLGWAYYKAGDFIAAQTWLARAVRLKEGRDSVVNDHLGDAAMRNGDTATAQRAWRSAIELADKAPPGPQRERDAAVAQAARRKLSALETGARPELAPIAREDR